MNSRPPSLPIYLAAALPFALRFHGHKRVHNADEIMSVARRLVEHLERAGFVVMKRPPIGGGAALGRAFGSDHQTARKDGLSVAGSL